jgi:hypothetical protein
MTTNGDYIGKKDFSYFEYFDEIRISIYDGEERYEQVKKLTTNYNVDVRKQYINQEMFNNCGGWFESSELIDKTCYIPFYRLQIDWNLDIRLCCHDWKEKIVLGNLRYDSLENIWLDYFSAIREQLIKYNRKKLNPCKNCNVNGIQNIYTKKPDGLEHFNFFKEYYESKNNRQSNWNEIA